MAARKVILSNAAPKTRRSATGSRFKRALVAGALFCSLMIPAGGYFVPRYYAPPVPAEWRQQIRQHTRWVHELWLQSRFPKTVLDRKVEQAVRRVRLFPPAYFQWRQAEAHRFYDKPGSPEGNLGGETMPLEDSYWPAALRPGAIMVQGPEPTAHEMVHYVGFSHPGLMLSNCQPAAATGRYLAPRSFIDGQTDIPVRLEFSGSKATMHYMGKIANGSCEYDLAQIEGGFHHPTQNSEEHHNDSGSPGNELGQLARMEEQRLQKPGYGLFVIRMVAQGSTVRDAMRRALKPDLERERKDLIRNNPILDWSENLRP